MIGCLTNITLEGSGQILGELEGLIQN